MNTFWTLDKPKAFLSTCHLERVDLDGIVVKYCKVLLNNHRHRLQVMDVRHGNINKLIGACVEPGHLCLVALHCSKGSLADVLANSNIRLDNVFRISFVSDITNVLAS